MLCLSARIACVRSTKDLMTSQWQICQPSPPSQSSYMNVIVHRGHCCLQQMCVFYSEFSFAVVTLSQHATRTNVTCANLMCREKHSLLKNMKVLLNLWASNDYSSFSVCHHASCICNLLYCNSTVQTSCKGFVFYFKERRIIPLTLTKVGQ